MLLERSQVGVIFVFAIELGTAVGVDGPSINSFLFLLKSLPVSIQWGNKKSLALL